MIIKTSATSREDIACRFHDTIAESSRGKKTEKYHILLGYKSGSYC